MREKGEGGGGGSAKKTKILKGSLQFIFFVKGLVGGGGALRNA